MNANSIDESGDELRFLKRAEIFENLDLGHLRIVLERGTINSYRTPGSVLFQLGEPADALYVVKSGVVEICRAKGETEALSVVAYLGESDTIGEMAITTGSPRGSLARIPQRADVFKLAKKAFNDLMQEIPEFANSLLTVMSRRLEDRLRKQRVAARYQHLSGDLQYFDLDTLIQAIAGSGRSGTFTILQSTGSIFAELYFDLGRIRYAKLDHLKGKQAVYQLFQSPQQASFTFRSGPLPADFTDEEEIVASTTGLLMECAHQQDEFRTLKTDFPKEQQRFRPQTNVLTWQDSATQALAKQIWHCIRQNASIAQMVKQLPYSACAVYTVLSEMQRKKLIA